MGLDIGMEAAWCTPEAVVLCCPHSDELPPPCQQGAQLLGLRIGDRAGRGADRFSKVSEGTGVERIRLGYLARSLGKIPRLARIDHDHGQGSRCQRRHDCPLEPSSGFKHDELGAYTLYPRDKICDSHVIIGDSPASTGGAQRHVESAFGHINPNQHLGRQHRSTPDWPDLV